MWKQIAPAFRMMIVLTVLTGMFYPAAVTGLCQAFFRRQANGSLIRAKGQPIGSALIGQNFARPEYLHPRPSAAGSGGYDATASQGSNYGPTNKNLIDRVRASIVKFHMENPTEAGAIPADLATASASGLDPHVSPASAMAQADRIASARGVTASQIRQIVAAHTEGRTLGFLGEPRVNVLQFNLDLDRQISKRSPHNGS